MEQTGKNNSASPEKPAQTDKSSVFDHPIGFWFFFWGEFAERCCYYGMRAILLLYMIDKIGLSDGAANSVMSYFMALCYLLPLVGGYIADNYLGKYWTIVGFSIPYVIGQLLLCIDANILAAVIPPDSGIGQLIAGMESKIFLTISLALLAMGTGVIKPNISSLMGMTYDQRRPGRTKLRSDAFAMFYGAINIGAGLSQICMPWLRTHYGYQIAFLFPAVLMTIALFIFAVGKRFYAVETITRVKLTPEQRHERFVVLRRIGGLFGVIVFFWCIFDQSATTWTLFARDHLVLVEIFGWKIDPDQVQALNAVFIVLLLAPITITWHLLADIGIKLRPTDKMLIGFIITGLTMLIMSIAGFLAGDGRVSIWWQIIPYIMITAAEICISVVGLELAFTAAPKNMKSFITGCWFLAVFLGDIINAQITPLYNNFVPLTKFKLTPGIFFGLLALLMVPVTIAFILVSKRFNRSAPD
jgi:dipeptide/tripeptide permease